MTAIPIPIQPLTLRDRPPLVKSLLLPSILPGSELGKKSNGSLSIMLGHPICKTFCDGKGVFLGVTFHHPPHTAPRPV